ncbi:MAG: transcriptional repressor [Anaerolineae bacterium]|nr:transcriptional repressor [Anaerolineae bacterium]
MSNKHNRLEELVARLRERGCRLTPQRMAVLKILTAGNCHPSVQEIYCQVRDEFPMMSLATVYSTLALLKEMGEVQELSWDGCRRYDAASSSPHPHLICLQCGEIVDLESDLLGNVADEIARRTGYQIVSHRFEFFAICPRCQEAACAASVGG